MILLNEYLTLIKDPRSLKFHKKSYSNCGVVINDLYLIKPNAASVFIRIGNDIGSIFPKTGF